MNKSNEPQNEPMAEKDWDLCKWASSLDTYEEYLEWFKTNKESGHNVQNQIPCEMKIVKKNEPMTKKDWNLCRWSPTIDTYEKYLKWFKDRIYFYKIKKSKDNWLNSVSFDVMEKYSKWYRETMIHNKEDFKDNSGQIRPEHEWDSWKDSRDSDPWELETKVVVVRDPEWEKLSLDERDFPSDIKK